MFYTYVIQSEEKYGFGVCSELLYKKLPVGLCYFEVFADRTEAKQREKYLKSLRSSRILSLIKSKKIKGFTCHTEGEKTVICLKNGIYNLKDAISVRGENIELRGEKNTIIQGCVKIDGWVDEGNGVFSAKTEHDADALYINNEKYQMARFPKYNPNVKISNRPTICNSPKNKLVDSSTSLLYYQDVDLSTSLCKFSIFLVLGS